MRARAQNAAKTDCPTPCLKTTARAAVAALVRNRPFGCAAARSPRRKTPQKSGDVKTSEKVCAERFFATKNPKRRFGRKDWRSSLFNSADRTLCCARTTIYAEICRNFEFAVAFADSVAGANTLATAASNTIITDFVSHNVTLLSY